MAHGHSDHHLIARTHNTARFFTESRHIAWVLLLGTLVWGLFGYWRMPQRKDPDIPIRMALVLVPWPGISAEKIEQLVTRRIEDKIGENAKIEKLESNTRAGLAAIYVTLVDGVADVGKELDDIKLKLDAIHDLPDGAGPIIFHKDFGDTAALMLTIASPKVAETEISLRARHQSEPENPRVCSPFVGPITISATCRRACRVGLRQRKSSLRRADSPPHGHR